MGFDWRFLHLEDFHRAKLRGCRPQLGTAVAVSARIRQVCNGCVRTSCGFGGGLSELVSMVVRGRADG